MKIKKGVVAHVAATFLLVIFCFINIETQEKNIHLNLLESPSFLVIELQMIYNMVKTLVGRVF